MTNKSNRIDPDYHFRKYPKEFGPNGLVSGQWWPLQLATLRDGAHGETQAGISGRPGKGATSVLVAGGHEKDVDQGNVILYCGTEGTADKGRTDDTNLLIDNIRTGEPVRVIRSSKLGNTPLAPSFGYRYDGLYNVVSHELLDERKHYYRFRLERQRDQDPIRSTGLGKRPTWQDVKKFQDHRLLSH